MGLVVITDRYVLGVPAPDQMRPLLSIPPDAERVKVRFRNDKFAMAVIKAGKEVYRRPILDKGDFWHVADWDMEQGRNITL